MLKFKATEKKVPVWNVKLWIIKSWNQKGSYIPKAKNEEVTQNTSKFKKCY